MEKNLLLLGYKCFWGWVCFFNSAMISPYSIYSMQDGYKCIYIYIYIQIGSHQKTCAKKIVHQPDLSTLLRQIHPKNTFLFALGGSHKNRKPLRLMSVSIEYQSPQDSLESRWKGIECVCVCQNWSFLGRFAKFDACIIDKHTYKYVNNI